MCRRQRTSARGEISIDRVDAAGSEELGGSRLCTLKPDPSRRKPKPKAASDLVKAWEVEQADTIGGDALNCKTIQKARWYEMR